MVNVKVFVLKQKILILVDYGKCKGFCSFSEQAPANAFSKEDRMPANIDCFVVDSFTSKRPYVVCLSFANNS